MSNKQNLQKALETLAKAKQEDTNRVNKAVETVQKSRQESEEKQNRQS